MVVCWLADWYAGCVGISLGACFFCCVDFSFGFCSDCWLIVAEGFLSVLAFVWDFVNSVDLFTFCC